MSDISACLVCFGVFQRFNKEVMPKIVLKKGNV